MEDKYLKVRTPEFPPYSRVRHLLRIWDGFVKSDINAMMNDIWEQTGTPQHRLDWSDPDEWIPERLKANSADIAIKTWKDSNRQVNPRHLSGSIRLINRYELLITDSEGSYRITERGQGFLDENRQDVRKIDEAEGIPELLSLLATKTHAKRGDLLPEWTEFLLAYSNFGSPSTIKHSLRDRLANMRERGFVRMDGLTWIITDKGVDYAAAMDRPRDDPRTAVYKAVNLYNLQQRNALKERLKEINPYRFEHLISELLEAMGYEEVTVTKESGDRGVDVVATVQFGITTIKEVVQVKRKKRIIGRPVLDQLRGSLPYHKAIRGTLITTGKFSRDCKNAALYVGAAPIGLIDGEKLLDLLIEHEIGMKKRSAQLHEVDEQMFDEEEVAIETLE